MIYYFSGTGNTRRLATLLARQLDTEAIDIRQWLLSVEPLPLSFAADTSVGFAFPVYGWGLPLAVEAFLKRLPDCAEGASLHVFALLSCGDDIGHTHHQLRRLLAAKGYRLAAVWSLQMPNTYIALPFFNTDAEEVARKKIETSERALPRIARRIIERQTGVVEVVEGGMPGLKSGMIRRFFNRFLISPRLFHTDHRCIACHRCVRVCPLHNVSVPDAQSGPQWGNACTFCLACYHVCPKHNILVRPSGTLAKGRSARFLSSK